MIRALLVVGCLVLFALLLWGMRAGWRHRAARQPELATPPVAPGELGAPRLAPLAGLYVGTAYATSWQDRVVAGGFGLRAAAAISLYEAGALIEREGASQIFLPVASIESARLAPGLAGKVVGAGGLLVIRWEHGGSVLDTAIRADDKSSYPSWVRTINERVSV
ncbi:MAG TPA: transporter [Jatrophihabitantaceae bacterium]|jgi:hypothetical protein|nr:transporter [Jatrophihabitantaceae bacterium]